MGEEQKQKKSMSKKIKVVLGLIVVLSAILIFSPYARGRSGEIIQDVIIEPVSCLYKSGLDFCTTNRHPEGALVRKMLEDEKRILQPKFSDRRDRKEEPYFSNDPINNMNQGE